MVVKRATGHYWDCCTGTPSYSSVIKVQWCMYVSINMVIKSSCNGFSLIRRLNECRLLVNWTFRNRLYKCSSKCFSVKWLPFCLDFNMLGHPHSHEKLGANTYHPLPLILLTRSFDMNKIMGHQNSCPCDVWQVTCPLLARIWSLELLYIITILIILSIIWRKN